MILETLFSSGMVTDSVKCGVDSDVSVGGCPDESHEDSFCEVATISGYNWFRVT